MSLDALRKQRDIISTQIREVEEQERQAGMEAMIGKFFKYRNCYSCPQKESDYWWLYGTFVRLNGKVYSVTFQVDKDGKFEMTTREELYPMSGWSQITKREYISALDRSRRRVEQLRKLANSNRDGG